MTIPESEDYLSERLAHWNRDPRTAITLLGGFLSDKSMDDLDLLAVDRRDEDAMKDLAVFVGHVGLEITDGGFPDHGDSLIRASRHETSKSKQFYDFVSASNGFYLRERRIYLPREETVVAHLFRATREKPKI